MNYLYILLAISFAISAVGWVYFIYFFSIGYGFAAMRRTVRLWHQARSFSPSQGKAFSLL